VNYRASWRRFGHGIPVCLNDIEINERKTKLARGGDGGSASDSERNGSELADIKTIPGERTTGGLHA